MLSVTSVNGYNPYFKANVDNEAKKVPMRAVSRRPQKQKDERTEYEKKVRNAKISKYVSLGSSILLAVAFATMAVVGVKQYKLQKLQTEMMNLVDKETPANWETYLNIVSKDEIAKHRGFDDMVQNPKIKAFWDNFLNRLNNRDFFSKGFGKKGCSMLFYGPPGTGKTEGVFALAKYFGDDAILNMIDCNTLKSMWHGGSESKIINSLKAAKELCKQNPNKKVIVLIDEFSIANKAKGMNDNLITDMQDAFKAHLLDLIGEPNAIVVATTNHGAKDVPLDTLMDSAILDRFAMKEYFPAPIKVQWKDLFKRRAGQLENAGVVEAGFYTRNEAKFDTLAQKMEEGHASYRSYWLGVEEQVQNISAARFSKNNLIGDARKITIDDFEQAVDKCAKEENWGVKPENKGFDFEDFLQGMLAAMSKNNGAA